MGRRYLRFICACVFLYFSPSALAYEQGDWIIRAGIASVQPNEEATPLTLNGAELSTLGLGLPRTEASVDANQQIGITITRMLSPNWGIELLAATPFSHEIDAEALGVKAAEIKHLPPTLSAQYYLNGGDSPFQPFVGVGINYTVFFDEEVDTQLNSALAGLGATGEADLELDASIGYALETGIDYQYNDRWLVNITLWYIDISTDANFSVPGLGNIETEVDIDPWVIMGSFGITF